MNQDNMDFSLWLAAKIRERRRELGITQEKLCQMASCGVAFLYLLETGKPTVRLDKVIDVLRALDLEVSLKPSKDIALPNVPVMHKNPSFEDFID